MVTRYSHIALVTIETGGKVTKGKYVEGNKEVVRVKGRYDSVSDPRFVVKKNAMGEEKEVSGQFYTSCRKMEGATHIVIDSLGVDVPIICWDQFQSYSVINV